MYRFSGLLFLSLLLLSCQHRKQQPAQDAANTDNTGLPDGFGAFYRQFHTDSMYQMAHILWPLPGSTSEQVDSVNFRKVSVNWQKEDWRMHRQLDLSSGEFRQDFQTIGDDIVVERIRYAAANYGLERRFSRGADGEWALIYYQDMMEGR